MRNLVALLLALVIALPSSGCAFAVKQPAVTVGVTAFVLAEGMCEMAVDGENLKCLGLSGGIGAGLAGVVLLAQLLGGPGDTVLMGREGEVPASDEPLPVLERDPAPPDDPPPAPAPPPSDTPAPSASSPSDTPAPPAPSPSDAPAPPASSPSDTPAPPAPSPSDAPAPPAPSPESPDTPVPAPAPPPAPPTP